MWMITLFSRGEVIIHDIFVLLFIRINYHIAKNQTLSTDLCGKRFLFLKSADASSPVFL